MPTANELLKIAEKVKKIHCFACNGVIGEGSIERGCLAIRCRHCGHENTIFVTGEAKERYKDRGLTKQVENILAAAKQV